MLDSIIKMASDQLGGTIQQKTGLAPQEGQKAISMLQGPLMDTIKGQVSSGNISGLTDLFGGKTPVAGNSIVDGIVKNYASTLVSKMGLSGTVANTLSSIAVPFVTEKIVSSFASKGGVNMDSISSLLGNNAGAMGNIAKGLGGLGKLFGK